MAECATGDSATVTVTEEVAQSLSQQRLVLKLKKPKSNKKVQWDESAVDNEFMGKKTSKCCCIYEKARKFGDSSSSESDSDDEGCSHNAYCSGHKSDKHHDHDQSKGGDPSNPQDTSS